MPRLPGQAGYHLRMRLAFATLALALLCAFALSEQGQGPVDPGPILTGELNLGEYWFGRRIQKTDLAGKIVLVEIWGS